MFNLALAPNLEKATRLKTTKIDSWSRPLRLDCFKYTNIRLSLPDFFWIIKRAFSLRIKTKIFWIISFMRTLRPTSFKSLFCFRVRGSLFITLSTKGTVSNTNDFLWISLFVVFGNQEFKSLRFSSESKFWSLAHNSQSDC